MTPVLNDTQYVLRTDKEGVATLTLNRPKQYNALSLAMLNAVLAHLEAIEKDATIQVVIIGAAGKAFCPGHDLKEMRANRDKDFGDRLFAKCSEMMLKIRQLKQPVIAKIQGIATAAGCQLVATCDLAIAADHARFATSGINYGLFCSTPAVALSRSMQSKKALEMLLTGEFISAETAKAEGLINRVVPAADLDEATWKFAKTIADKAQDALKIGKEMFYEQLDMDIVAAYQYASDKIVCNFLEEDAKEGLDAFAEKRQPNWKKNRT
jgi:enoyl-CoA hydratase/carnithine racemase